MSDAYDYYISLFPVLHTYFHCHFTFTKNDTSPNCCMAVSCPLHSPPKNNQKKYLIFISPGQLNRTRPSQTKPPRHTFTHISSIPSPPPNTGANPNRKLQNERSLQPNNIPRENHLGKLLPRQHRRNRPELLPTNPPKLVQMPNILHQLRRPVLSQRNVRSRVNRLQR